MKTQLKLPEEANDEKQKILLLVRVNISYSQNINVKVREKICSVVVSNF